MRGQMRGAVTRTLLDAIRRLPADESAEVLKRIPPPSLAAIDAVGVLGWLPMQTHMDASEALLVVVGAPRHVEIWRDVMTRSFDRPFLRGFVQMSASLFAETPTTLLRQSERLFPYLAKDLGVMRFEQSDRPCEGALVLRGFPADRYSLHCFFNGLLGCAQSALVVLGVDGSVEVEDADASSGTARFRLRWRER